ALAFCTWAGKRLCGGIGGGAALFGGFANPALDEWYAACTNSGQIAFPYGTTYAPTTCNGKDRALTNALVAVASLPGCTGGISNQLFDLSGNAWEWEDSCSGTAATDACRIRGGGFFSAETTLRCAADATLGRNLDIYVDVGFRCCSP